MFETRKNNQPTLSRFPNSTNLYPIPCSHNVWLSSAPQLSHCGSRPTPMRHTQNKQVLRLRIAICQCTFHVFMNIHDRFQFFPELFILGLVERSQGGKKPQWRKSNLQLMAYNSPMKLPCEKIRFTKSLWDIVMKGFACLKLVQKKDGTTPTATAS